MNINIWILLYMCGWLNGVKCIHLTCNSMGGLANKTNISCKQEEMIYVNEQFTFNFLGSDVRKDVNINTECKNSTSSKCFRTLAKDYVSYFNISKSCNGKKQCAVGYNDMYDTAIQFANSCKYSKGNYINQIEGSDFDLIMIGVSNECFNYKNQIIVRKNISETRDGSLYLRSNETGRCLIKGSIESARILEQVNMTFTVSGRKSRLCAEMLPNGWFIYNEDLSCLVGINGFYLDIQTMEAKSRKLWMEFKGTSLHLECGDNIQLPNESEPNDVSTLFPMIIGLVAGLLLLLVLILIVLKRRKALTTRAETKHCTMSEGTTLQEYQNRTYYNDDALNFQDDVEDIQEIPSSFDDFIYTSNNDANYEEINIKNNTSDSERINALNFQDDVEDIQEIPSSFDDFIYMSNNDANYEEINIKNNTSDSERINGEQNVKKGTDDTEGSREESRDLKNLTPVYSKTAENKPNSFISEVTDCVYAAVHKTDDLRIMRIN